jgi:hypothetical protein
MELLGTTVPAILVFIVAASGCGSGQSGGLPGEVGTYDDGGLSFMAGEAGARDALDAQIERNHVAVTFITLSCKGDCADVRAVASGGNPPYTFRWDDGSTGEARQVCPASTTRYEVTVSDTGTTGELAHSQETAQASLAANVLSCPEGGVSSDDGGAPSGCVALGDVFFLSGSSPGIDGASDDQARCDDAGPSYGSIYWREDGAPIVLGGVAYSLSWSVPSGSTAWTFDVYGDSTECDLRDELASGVDVGPPTGCANLSVPRDASYLRLPNSTFLRLSPVTFQLCPSMCP